MKKTLAMILAAASIAMPSNDCEPEGYEYIPDEEKEWYCNCELIRKDYNTTKEGCGGRFEDLTYNPFNFGFEADMSKLEEKFGKGLVKVENRGINRKVEYEGMSARFSLFKIDVEYDITSPNFVLKYGIKVGMERDKLMDILGTPNLVCPNQDVYACYGRWGGSSLTIRYEDEKISRIKIYALVD